MWNDSILLLTINVTDWNVLMLLAPSTPYFPFSYFDSIHSLLRLPFLTSFRNEYANLLFEKISKQKRLYFIFSIQLLHLQLLCIVSVVERLFHFVENRCVENGHFVMQINNHKVKFCNIKSHLLKFDLIEIVFFAVNQKCYFKLFYFLRLFTWSKQLIKRLHRCQLIKTFVYDQIKCLEKIPRILLVDWKFLK